jgi:hypothetical protein
MWKYVYLYPGLAWSVSITIIAAFHGVFSDFDIKVFLRAFVGVLCQAALWPVGLASFLYCRAKKLPFALTRFTFPGVR